MRGGYGFDNTGVCHRVNFARERDKVYNYEEEDKGKADFTYPGNMYYNEDGKAFLRMG